MAKRGCTQEDAPALEIIASQIPYAGEDLPKPPYLRFELAMPPDTTQQTSVSYVLMPLLRNPEVKTILVRGQLVATQLNHQWLSGSITLDRIIPGQELSGHYAVYAADNQLWQMDFHAKYLNNTSVCG